MGIRLSVLASGLAAVATVAGACTIFNGVTATTCSSTTTGYLPLAQAARACNYILNCDDEGLFMGDIESSVGVVTSTSSYAYCMNALAGAIPPTRPGNDVASAAFACVATATSCAAARACMGVESIIPGTDPRCAPSAHVPDSGIYCANAGNDIVDCTDAGSQVQHCAAPPFNTEGLCDDPAWQSGQLLLRRQPGRRRDVQRVRHGFEPADHVHPGDQPRGLRRLRVARRDLRRGPLGRRG